MNFTNNMHPQSLHSLNNIYGALGYAACPPPGSRVDFKHQHPGAEFRLITSASLPPPHAFGWCKPIAQYCGWTSSIKPGDVVDEKTETSFLYCAPYRVSPWQTVTECKHQLFHAHVRKWRAHVQYTLSGLLPGAVIGARLGVGKWEGKPEVSLRVALAAPPHVIAWAAAWLCCYAGEPQDCVAIVTDGETHAELPAVESDACASYFDGRWHRYVECKGGRFSLTFPTLAESRETLKLAKPYPVYITELSTQ